MHRIDWRRKDTNSQTIFSSRVPRKYVFIPITHSSILICPSLSRSNALKTISQKRFHRYLKKKDNYLDPWEYHPLDRMYCEEYHENDFDLIYLQIQEIFRRKSWWRRCIPLSPFLVKWRNIVQSDSISCLETKTNSFIRRIVTGKLTMKSLFSFCYFINDTLYGFSRNRLSFSMGNTLQFLDRFHWKHRRKSSSIFTHVWRLWIFRTPTESRFWAVDRVPFAFPVDI